MKPTSRETYRIVRAVLLKKRFTQYEISVSEDVTFSLVNRVVNWLVDRGYVQRREGRYELIAAAAILNLFPIYRRLKPYEILDVNLDRKTVLGLVKGKGTLCLASALAFYDDYFRDQGIHVYLDDEQVIKNLRASNKGYCHIELYKNDLGESDSVKIKGLAVTSKIRTIIDLFCNNRAYAAERLVKREWSR